jgi:hypothetical protein
MTKSLDLVSVRDISELEQCSMTNAYRKFREYKIKLNLLSTKRNYITVNELAHCLHLTLQQDIDEIKSKLKLTR